MASQSLQEQLAAALQLQGSLKGLLSAHAGLGGQAAPFGAPGFVPQALPARHPLEGEGSDDLITPTNGEGGPMQVQQLPVGTAAAAPPAPLFAPPPPQQCLLCGGLGTQASCGPLRPASFEGLPVAVHHLCAIWCPGCFQREGSSVYVNLEEEARRSQRRGCAACGQLGASLPCAHPGCRAAYHLPCAQGALGVVLERDTFEAWCPAHADPDGAASDDDFSLAAPRPRRLTGVGGSASAKRPRATSDAQRPRTDWQKRDDFTWLKVVPPWWCEHRTVHFATKVFKELFRSAAAAVLVDPQGAEWQCVVQSEARNDLRPQYTLRGAFAELWEALGICAGDTLIFRRDAASGTIALSRHAAGSAAATAARMEEATGSELSGPSAHEPAGGTGGRAARPAAAREASSEQTARGGSQQGSHPNRWLELADGWAIKTVYKSTLQHQQCPIAGWLFKKLYGRLPGDADRALMYDPDLDTEYRFDVQFVAAANVHYVTGRTFSSWVRESGLQAGEQVRIRREGPRVHIQRVPLERKVHITYGKGASRSVSLGGSEAVAAAAVAGAPANHGQELASPPPPDALEAMAALAAAAGFAGTHGTPAIQAALAAGGGMATAANAAAIASGDRPALKRRRVGEADAVELMLAQQEQQVLLARQAAASGGAGWPAAAGGTAAAGPATLEGWQPSSTHTLMLREIGRVLEGHQWSASEADDCLRFRAKYAWLDACGREVAYEEVKRLAADRPALLTFVRALAQGIFMPLPQGSALGVLDATAVTPLGAGPVPAASPQRAAPASASPAPALPLAHPAVPEQPAVALGPQAEPQAGGPEAHEAPLHHQLEDAPGAGLEGTMSSVLSLDLLLG